MSPASKVVDKSTTSTLDAAQLARAWRAVAAVSGTDKNSPALDHTIYIEQYEAGIRLVATDSCRLLVAWVPEHDWTDAHEPDLDELPHASAVAVDKYGRAKNLLGYMGQQAAKEENDGLTALVRLGVPWQALDVPNSVLQFDGFDALVVDIEYVDNERLQLPVFEGPFPDWRPLLGMHKPKRTTGVALAAQMLDILAKAAKPFEDDCVVRLTFAGSHNAIAVSFGDKPSVRGLIMPVRWDFERNVPEDDGDGDGVVVSIPRNPPKP